MNEPFIRINTNNRYNTFKSINSYSKNGDELNVSQVSRMKFVNKTKNNDSGINLIVDKIIRISRTNSINWNNQNESNINNLNNNNNINNNNKNITCINNNNTSNNISNNKENNNSSDNKKSSEHSSKEKISIISINNKSHPTLLSLEHELLNDESNSDKIKKK